MFTKGTRMKKVITAALMGGVAAAATAAMVGVATPANADYAWVADQSADICNYLSLQKSVPSTDWVTLSISSLQLSQDVSRAEAVTGIRQAATSYCPQHLSVVPVR
jgi:hypothetical protein